MHSNYLYPTVSLASCKMVWQKIFNCSINAVYDGELTTGFKDSQFPG